MARTFGILTPRAIAAQAPSGNFHHQATEQDYVVSRRGGKLYLRRSIAGFDGKPTDVLETEMSAWIGSGNHARSFLSRGSQGKLVELPLTWYSAGAKWGMSPGYDIPFHSGFSRKITYGCLFCHAGYPDLPPGADQNDGNWKLPEPLAEGIDCQRCHGPGESHAVAAKTGRTLDQIRGAIINPAKLDARRGMEVCLQCHLETTTVRLPGFLRKYDRGAFSYRAGEPLENFVLHFEPAVDADRDERVEFAGEAYRLRMSACFRESKGALTCTTCHNPHAIPRGDAAARAYAAICQGCHGAAVSKLVETRRHPASQDCIACHMPKRKPVDALNTVVSDHFIRKRPQPEPPGLRAEHNDSTAKPYRGEVKLYYPPALPDGDENALYLALAQVRNRANLENGLPRFDALINRLKPPEGDFYIDLAEAWRQAGQPEKGVAYARQATERMPSNWRAWFGLGNMLSAAGDLAHAAEIFRKAANLAPDEPGIAQALGEAYAKQGNFVQALSAYRAAVAADPDFAEGHNNAGTTLMRMGDPAGAEKELREAVRLRPESSAMQVNLAGFLASRGAMPEARRRFTLALKMNPEYAEGHAAFGLALARSREWPAARREFEHAVRLNPKAPVTRHNLGVALLELNELNAALRQFEAAVDLDPKYRDAR